MNEIRFTIMKKSLLFFTLLAGIAVMTGCKKDQDVVTLKAVVERDTKAYFGPDTYTPYWETGDKVIINGNEKVLTLPSTPTTYATILRVNASDNYCAIYPANIVERMGTPTASGTTATIYFDPHQKYIEKNGHQCVNMPMGAVTNNRDKTFYFKNLCSILRLQVKNTLQTTIKVKRITIYAYGAYLAGSADVTLAPDPYQNGETVITEIRTDGPAGTDVENVLSIYAESGYMKSLDPSTSDYIDIVVPPFDASSLNIELEIYDDQNVFLGNTDADIDDPPAVNYNKVITINYENYRVETPDYAYLLPGPQFNTTIKSLIGNNIAKDLVFNTSYTPGTIPEETDVVGVGNWSGWVVVSRTGSPFRIYATLSDPDDEGKRVVEIYSQARYYYADSNSSRMFEGLSNLESMHWNTSETSGFQTEDVTDLSYMFAGCTKLNGIYGLSSSNFSNVRNASHMFENNEAAVGWNMTLTMNTHNLRNIEAMFKGCKSLGSIDLSSFTTNRVTSMKDLFKNTHLSNIYINNFVISNGTDLTGAFVGIGMNQNNPGNIYCTETVETLLSNQGADVIDQNAVFHRP